MKSTRLFSILFFAFFFWGKSNGQNIDPKLADALQHTLDSMHQTLGTMGLGAAVQLPNGAVWASGSGVSSLSPLDSIGPGHRFATGSSTKTITAACILQLADEGLLSIDDSLFLWLPEFDYIDHNITIRQLMQHTSGIYDILQNPSFGTSMDQNPNQIWELEDVVSEHILPPAFAPGSSWGYSNTNYILLGMIIETITGKPYHQEINDRFFTPLNIGSYINLAYDPEPDTVAHLWLDISGDGVVDDAHLFFTGLISTFSAIGPAGGYFATPSDLAIWMRASMSGSLVSPEIWAEATGTVNTSFPFNSKYGLGLIEQQHLGFLAYGHGGDLAGYNTQALYFPEKDISIAICGNDANIISWNLTNTMRALLRTYIECEPVFSSADELGLSNVSVSIFPNPFFENIKVTVDLPQAVGQMDLFLTDIYGHLIWSASQKNVAAQRQIFDMDGLSEIPPGTYFLNTFLDGNTVGPIRLIKRKE